MAVGKSNSWKLPKNDGPILFARRRVQPIPSVYGQLNDQPLLSFKSL